VTFHTNVQGLDAPQDEPGLEGAQDTARALLHKTESLVQGFHGGVRPEDDDTSKAIAMTVNVLGRTVDDDMGPQPEGLLEIRRHERIVHDQEGTGGRGDASEGRYIGHLQEGITGRLDEDPPGLTRPDAGRRLLRRDGVKELHVHAPGLKDGLE
jgi:hypothetical protein